MTPVAQHGQLKLSGPNLVDAHGRVTTLRGVSLFWSHWGRRFYNRDAIEWLCDDWGVTVVRAPLAVTEETLATGLSEEIGRVRQVVEAAIAVGVYVIVDWHAHVRATAEAAATLEGFARDYGRHPNILYETWNEPSTEYCWSSDIKPHHLCVLEAIRRHDTLNVVIAGTEHWSQRVDVAWSDPLSDPAVCYALHFYARSHRDSLRNRAIATSSAGAPLFVSEWAGCEADGDGQLDRASTAKWLRFLDDRAISNVAWSLIDKAETSAALKGSALASGGWTMADLTPSGRHLRKALRRARATDRLEPPTWFGLAGEKRPNRLPPFGGLKD